MKKRMLSFVIMVAVLIASFSALTAFAATETLDLSASALRTLNGADDLDDEEAQSGATWSQVGFWRDQTGGDTDCLMPFAEEWPAVPALGDTHIVFMNYEGYIPRRRSHIQRMAPLRRLKMKLDSSVKMCLLVSLTSVRRMDFLRAALRRLRMENRGIRREPWNST